MATSTLGSGTLVLAGTTSGTTTVTATAVAGTTTLTLPAATDTLVGKATTDTLTNKTLTGAVMNGTLGATTPSTVAATTLTTSSTVTHNGGTANGVAYLDGSKVLTTGSALVFDGTNLGVGVTPSAWASYKAIDISSIGSLASVSGQMSVFNNSYWNGSNLIYKTTNFATYYNQNAGTHAWYNAASGTAGNAITFTQAMTLDASGNLVIGATSTSQKLRVYDSGSNTVIRAENGTSAFEIQSNVNDGYINMSGTGNIIFRNGSGFTERARIDSSGNLLVGQTTSGVVNINGIALLGSAGGQAINHVNGTGSGSVYMYYGYNGATIGSITQSGTTAVLFNVTSDQRLKENIVDADDAASLIDSLQVRKFDWKTDNTHQRYGFVAQELVTVAPEAVHQPINEEDMMAVDYSKLVPMLVKEIQSLRKRLAALESA